MITLLGQFFRSLAESLKLVNKRNELKNSEEMKRNAKAKSDAEVRERATKAVASNDLNEIRRQAGE